MHDDIRCESPRTAFTLIHHLMIKAVDEENTKSISKEYVDPLLKSNIEIQDKGQNADVQMDNQFGFEH